MYNLFVKGLFLKKVKEEKNLKKLQLLTAVLLLTVLTACGTAGKTTDAKGNSQNQTSKSAKNKLVELSVENGQYIEPKGGENEDGTEYLALELKYKNISKEKMFVADSSFYLFEKGKDSKISPIQMSYDEGFDFFGEDLASGKSATGTVVFEVDSSKKYVLAMSTMTYDTSGKPHNDVELAVDLSKYEESKKELENPKKALSAYIDVVFLQKENADYEELVGNDPETDRAIVEKAFGKKLKDYILYKYKPSDEELKATYKEFVKNQNTRVELTIEQKSYSGKKATLGIDFKGISMDSVAEMFSEARSDAMSESDDFDYEKGDKAAFSKLSEIYKLADVGEPRSEINMTLTKKEDKWFIDFKKEDSYENTQLIQAFIGNVN